jgi:phage terminase large subunit-like protein
MDKKAQYEELATKIGKLVDEKNQAYGNSFAEAHKILSILYPNGIQPEQYTDALAIIRVIDKLFRIATNKNAFGESPWQDIAGYAILGVSNHEGKKK